MTRATTEKLIGQLRVLHQLTISESQVAQSRQVQARTDDVRQRFASNAVNAQQRAKLIAAALRELGSVPDVIAPALSRATSLVKTVVAQGQPLTDALFADLALEHQLLDRARYLEVFANAAGHIDTRLLAQHLQVAHRDTVEWITSVLEQEACGKPAAVQPTPVQKAVGRLTRAANYPARQAAAQLNEAAAAVLRTRSRVATATEATVESFSVGREAEQSAIHKRAHINASTLHFAGGLNETELTSDRDDDLTVNEVEDAVQKLSDPAPLDVLLRYVLKDPAALDALLRYTRDHGDHVRVSSGIENQLTEVNMGVSNGN